MPHCDHRSPLKYDTNPAPDRHGWLKTTCKECGRFIGYHPVPIPKPSKKTKPIEAEIDEKPMFPEDEIQFSIRAPAHAKRRRRKKTALGTSKGGSPDGHKIKATV